MKYDVVIIGGGAAGLCAAVNLKRMAPQLSVLIAERLPRVGKKLIITGNGRCNITNKSLEAGRFHGEHSGFASYALNAFGNSQAEEFFRSIGVVITYDSAGRAYPYSLQASSVVDMLRFACDELGVITRTDSAVTGIKHLKNGYELDVSGEKLYAGAVLAAAGLYSGGDKLGCDGSLLRILRDELGCRTVKTTPAIVQLKSEPKRVKSLKGIKVDAKASLIYNGRPLREEYGEVLFCDYGLSGPPIMQLSREVERRKGDFAVNLDIMPGFDFNTLCDILSQRAALFEDRPLEDFFTGMLNKRVGQFILKDCGFMLSDRTGTIKGSIKKIAADIKQLQFIITGTTGFINSQVTAGGLDTDGFRSDSMMSVKHEGLFAAGEILDIDGDCGGFNLQWAWSSSTAAAYGICRYLGVL